MAARKVNWKDVFPHTCKIYRIKTLDELSLADTQTEVLYEGECRDEGNSAMRTYQTDGVQKSDHALQIPSLLTGITNECIADIKNDQVELKAMQITNCQAFRYGKQVGTTIMYNEPKN